MTKDASMSVCTQFRFKASMIICGIVLAACTAPPRPYNLTTPLSQSGPQHLLLGQGMDINTVDAVALEALPGVGPALAQRIVDYRTSHGPFNSVQALRNVSGIGEKTLQHLSPLIRTSSNN